MILQLEMDEAEGRPADHNGMILKHYAVKLEFNEKDEDDTMRVESESCE